MSVDFSAKFLPKWSSETGAEEDVAISSRVRLARNLSGIPFPGRCNSKQLEEVNERVSQALNRQSGIPLDKPILMDKISPNERMVWVEKHLCSPQFAENPTNRLLLVDMAQSIGIMVNEEDHLRIQSIFPGFAIDKAFESANQLDDLLEESLEYAFDEQHGYLTACPTNTGTGLRASVMLHLPGLTLAGRIKQVLSALGHVGINVRGLYGEGTEAFGDMYQISNQMTLGSSEQDLLSNLQSVCRRVISEERTVRQSLLQESRIQLEDRIGRSYGILRGAKLLSGQETLRLLSDVKLGVDLKLISDITPTKVKELLFLVGTAVLQQIKAKEMLPAERDEFRATFIQERLRK